MAAPDGDRIVGVRIEARFTPGNADGRWSVHAKDLVDQGWDGGSAGTGWSRKTDRLVRVDEIGIAKVVVGREALPGRPVAYGNATERVPTRHRVGLVSTGAGSMRKDAKHLPPNKTPCQQHAKEQPDEGVPGGWVDLRLVSNPGAAFFGAVYRLREHLVADGL